MSAGKHLIDQSYALINLGTNGTGTSTSSVLFSDPLLIRPPGRYTAVAAGTFASLSTGHTGYLPIYIVFTVRFVLLFRFILLFYDRYT